MAMDQSALLELLAALRDTEINDRVSGGEREAFGTLGDQDDRCLSRRANRTRA